MSAKKCILLAQHYCKVILCLHGLMFAFLRQNHVCGDLIFAVSPGLVNYLGTWIIFEGINYCDLKMVANFVK